MVTSDWLFSIAHYSYHNSMYETSNADHELRLTLDYRWMFSDHSIFVCALESISFVYNGKCFSGNTYTFLTKDWNNCYSSSIHYEKCNRSFNIICFSVICPKHCCSNFTFLYKNYLFKKLSSNFIPFHNWCAYFDFSLLLVVDMRFELSSPKYLGCVNVEITNDQQNWQHF